MIFNVDCIMASDISRIVNGILYGNDCLIENVSLNSKMMAKNTCFLAIKGKNFDGYNYIKEALENEQAEFFPSASATAMQTP